jgi:hypothetical protein
MLLLGRSRRRRPSFSCSLPPSADSDPISSSPTKQPSTPKAVTPTVRHSPSSPSWTSASTKDADWLDKLDTYGRVVPVYLVLDMRVGEITAFWDPSPKGYRSRTTVPFGEPLHVPEPFDFDLDTSGFVVRPDAEGDAEG